MTLFSLPELHIDIKDYIDSETSPVLIPKGRSEWPNHFTGTSQFCNKHSCQDNAEILCTFGNPNELDQNSYGVKRNLATYTRARRRLLLTIVLPSLKKTEPCSHVVTLSVSEEECITSAEYDKLQLQSSLDTHSSTTQPRDLFTPYDDTPIGLLTVRVECLYFICHKRIEFSTRDHHFYIESVHKCRFAGSCSTGTCDNTKTNDWLKELSDTANRHPGYSFCAASCGCLTCESTTIYLVFNCPLWEFTVDVHVTLQTNQMSEGTDLRLQPAKTVRWNNILFTLVGSMISQMPILSSTFITNGEITAITKSATSGQLLSHTIGKLQCHTMEDAKIFNCTIASN
ncbi:hypothetical protein OSTOST_01948, partial [Ostertagia ostertagi]